MASEQIESLLHERADIERDLKKYGKHFYPYTHDCLNNRLEMIEYMLEQEGHYSK